MHQIDFVQILKTILFSTLSRALNVLKTPLDTTTRSQWPCCYRRICNYKMYFLIPSVEGGRRANSHHTAGRRITGSSTNSVSLFRSGAFRHWWTPLVIRGIKPVTLWLQGARSNYQGVLLSRNTSVDPRYHFSYPSWAVTIQNTEVR